MVIILIITREEVEYKYRNWSYKSMKMTFNSFVKVENSELVVGNVWKMEDSGKWVFRLLRGRGLHTNL